MDKLIEVLIIVGYISIAIELIFFHVPSVSSTVNLLKPEKSLTDLYSEEYRKLFYLPVWIKVIVFVIPVILIYFTFLYPFLHLFTDLFSQQLFTPSIITIVLSLLMIITGRVITILSVLRIRKQNKQKQDSFKLHTGLLFSKMRNPIQVGMYFFVIGIWLYVPSVTFLTGILMYIGYMHFKIFMEEDFLENKYGAAYKNYQSLTRRYI